MGLRLSSRDLTRYRGAVESLLSPLEYADTVEWCGELLHRMEALFRADRSILTIPVRGRVLAHSDSIPASSIHQFQSLVSKMSPGSFHSERADLDRLMKGRRIVGLEVWHNDALVHSAGVSLTSSPFYHEVVVPNGIAYGSGMGIGLPMGEAWLTVAHTRPEDDFFGVEAGTDLLRMLLPAFRAGANMLAQLDQQRDSLAVALDSVGHALLTCALDGRELHRSVHLRRILADEPEAERVVGEMRTLAATVVGLRRRPSKSAPLLPHPVGQRTVTTARSRYHLRAAFFAAAAFGDGSGVLVSLDEHAPKLPSAVWLRERYGLTPREAEVALLLAAGASNRQIAVRLGISPFTARAHAEHIFQKLGIHSRKALALELLSEQHAGGGPITA